MSNPSLLILDYPDFEVNIWEWIVTSQLSKTKELSQVSNCNSYKSNL